MQETGPEPVLGRDELGAMFRLFDVTNKGSVTVEQANAVRDADAPLLCATQAATVLLDTRVLQKHTVASAGKSA